MNIDYNKLIELLLPTFLRRPRLFALLRTLVSKPLQELFSQFHLWRVKSRYEASITPQVCSLIHAVKQTFDCVCEITELDGKPYDFLVEIDRSTDLNAIKEFINQHKLAGKSYIFKLGDVSFTALWINYANEDLVELYSAEWTMHVNEEDGVNRISISLHKNFDNNAWIVRARADKPVKSILFISVSVVYRIPPNGMIHHGGDASLSLAIGEQEQERQVSLTDEPGAVISFTASVIPNRDDFYTYTVNGGETWH